jgi:hypothetical protein
MKRKGWIVLLTLVLAGAGLWVVIAADRKSGGSEPVRLQQWWWVGTDGSPGSEQQYLQHIRTLGEWGAEAVLLYLGSYQADETVRKRVLNRISAIREARIPNVVIFDTVVGYGNGPKETPAIQGLHVTDPAYPEAAAQFVSDAESFLQEHMPGVQRAYWLEDEAKGPQPPDAAHQPWHARPGQVPYVDLCVKVAGAIRAKSPKCKLGADGYPWPELRDYVRIWAIPHDYDVDAMARQMKAEGFTVLGYWNRITLDTEGEPPDMVRFRQWLRSAGYDGALFYRWSDAAAAAWQAAEKSGQ